MAVVALIPFHDSNRPPYTGQIVADDDEHDDHENKVSQRADEFRLDPVEDLGEQRADLDRTKQPHRPQETCQPNGTVRLAEAHHGLHTRGNGDEDPVKQNNGGIHDEPRFHVLPGNLGRTHLQDSLTVEACQELDWDVDSPKDHRDPIHDGQKGGLFRLEGLERDQQHVIRQNHHTQEIPGQSLQTAWPHDQSLRHAALRFQRLTREKI
mmetsp:Transcript_55526/g.89786  ORF Transcript_55526/g.89786 Transcript_55526/m.89786 type:complete len:209 (+) Transcript_55526:419-1045(+)